MIRTASHADLDAVVSFGSDFHAYSPWREIEFDRDATKEFCARLIDGGVILMSDAGMIGGLMNPLYFNPSYKVACELFWWATSGGLKLMKAFENWGLENKASAFQFSALGDEKSDRMATLFERAGYRKVETGYFREV